ncbi:ATP-binding protein [Kitasatospora sp. LaBMicrA B282]|uniref:ATP-binding protein n=1 Tax=Kitasatospora sp. LaBMicrA B282 TaxID=3420949 RepID=UPI003D1435A9
MAGAALHSPRGEQSHVRVPSRVLPGPRSGQRRQGPSAGPRHARRPGIRLDEGSRDSLDVVVSELITNAIRHSYGPVLTVGVYADPRARRVLVEVYDASVILPRTRQAMANEETGRGLLLVERLALSHGAERTSRGKRVWAELAVPEQAMTRRQLLAHPRRVGRHLLDRLRNASPAGPRRDCPRAALGAD